MPEPVGRGVLTAPGCEHQMRHELLTPQSGALRTATPHPAPSRRKRRFGFTIIEVMIALGIFSMILIAIYSVWTGILKASKAARTAADSAQRARISMRALVDSLTTAQMFTANMPPQTRDAYYSFLADMSGEFGEISFVSHLPANFPGVGRFGDHVVRRVTFNVEPGKDGKLDLVMRQGPMMMAANPDYKPYELVLAKDVTLFAFEFWAQNQKTGNWEWTSEWSKTNQLPTLVHVGLGLGKTDKPGQPADIVHRYIALPATAVPPDAQMPVGISSALPNQPPINTGNPGNSGNPVNKFQ